MWRGPEKVALAKIGGGDVEMKVDGIRNRPIRVRAPAGHCRDTLYYIYKNE